ncbi:MAG: CoA transferase [Dehalococcoidia bacterium]|nr:CoA transferase [Dehalococcoidia bacterium]
MTESEGQELAPGPLEGMRVVDLTHYLSGPYCTMLLRDLGAEVVKVESLTGDPSRDNARAPGDTVRAYGGYFQSVNRGKKSVALDLKSTEGQEIVRRLAAGADALIENFKAGVMERAGLSYESLAEINPRLVYACIRGFGDPRTGDSPYRDWPAFDIVAQAMGGLMSMTGLGPGRPLRAGPALGDIVPGMLTALGIVAAVHRAARTGRGQFLDVAMYDSVLAICEQIVYRYSYLGEITEPSGNSHPFLCPFDVFPTNDGAIAICAPADHLWQELCRRMDRLDLAGDPSLTKASGRVQNCDRVRNAVREWTSVRSKGEVLAALAGNVPCGPVNSVMDIVNDPHFQSREMLVEMEQPGLDRLVQIPGCPIKLTETPAGPRGRAPLLGEHTDAVLHDLGYSDAQIQALRERSVLR